MLENDIVYNMTVESWAVHAPPSFGFNFWLFFFCSLQWTQIQYAKYHAELMCMWQWIQHAFMRMIGKFPMRVIFNSIERFSNRVATPKSHKSGTFRLRANSGSLFVFNICVAKREHRDEYRTHASYRLLLRQIWCNSADISMFQNNHR